MFQSSDEEKVRDHPERQYLDLLKRVLTEGKSRSDRTGVGTKAIFGGHMRFDLSKGFPLLTTKKVFFRGVVEELCWMIRGCTSSADLDSRGVRIWNENGSKEFLRSRGLSYSEGDLGPVYGFQWRHFGARYVDSKTDYSGQGVDQLHNVIRQIRDEPNSRRIILSAWNPMDIDKMALPPCHVMAQFWVDDSKLSCRLDQRSCDVGLGVPFNIASYSLLTHILARITNLGVGDFVYHMGDVHIYNTHMDALVEQLGREPYPFPQVMISDTLVDIDQLDPGDIDLVDYRYHKSIRMPMAV